MEWTIPGTVLQIRREDADGVEERISSMFLAGGMVLGQVASITGLEPYTIQNWVKRGYLSPPEKKRYSQRQLSRILIINMLRSALPLERICGLLEHINGHLDDESDDLIDDSQNILTGSILGQLEHLHIDAHSFTLLDCALLVGQIGGVLTHADNTQSRHNALFTQGSSALLQLCIQCIGNFLTQ